MSEFPAFMKNPINRIASSSQATPGVEGCVFDAADGNQMAFWTCGIDGTSAEQVHGYDEYMVVIEGCYTMLIQGQRINMTSGQEYLIPKASHTAVK